VDRLRFDIELFDDEDPFEIDCQRIQILVVNSPHAGRLTGLCSPFRS